MTLDARLGGKVTIDLCRRCEAFWFDGFESLQLSPASTLEIVKSIQSTTERASAPTVPVLRCPRCGGALALTHDLQNTTRFQYYRCPAGHGRFIGFVDFLREKSFIHPLTPDQIAELKEAVQVVNCANCGAPIDIAKSSVCAHCGSPLSMVDVAKALRQA